MMDKLRNQMRWIMLLIVVAFLLSTFLMYEGRSGRRGQQRVADGRMMDYEVAEVNGRALMRSELENRLRNYLENYGQRNVTSLDMPSIYQAVLDQYVLESQMAREVAAQGISISDAEADRAMKSYADQFYPTREAFYQALGQSGLTVDAYKRLVAQQMANERLLRSAIGEVSVSEDQAVQFYDTMKGLLYRRPEGFRVHLANFASSQDAEALRARLIAGTSWDLAVSGDVLSSQDVLNVTREPLFLPASSLTTGPLAPLDSLDVGQISPVFSMSSDDFAVGLKLERVSESVSPYDDVSSDIRTLLRQQQERQSLAEYEASLMAKAQVVIHDPSLFPQPASPDVAPVISMDTPISEDAAPAAQASPDAAPSSQDQNVTSPIQPASGDVASPDVP